jgi:hypothetical protein
MGGSGDMASPQQIEQIDRILYKKYRHLVEEFFAEKLTETEKLILQKYTESLSLFFLLERKEYKLYILENLRYLVIFSLIVGLQMLNRIQVCTIFIVNIIYMVTFLKYILKTVKNGKHLQTCFTYKLAKIKAIF